MVSDPSLVIYTCVSKGTTILAEFTTGSPDLDALALKCLENAPEFHSVYSHTVRNRSYTFAFDLPFVYFGIFDEKLEKSQGLSLLYGIKDAFREILEAKPLTGLDALTYYCFQSDMNPVFQKMLAPSLGMWNLPPPPTAKDSGEFSVDFSKGKKIVSVPLLGKPGKGLKKKRSSGDDSGDLKDIAGENKVVDVSDDASRDFSASLQKNGLFLSQLGRQKAMQKWKQHVWVVLSMDLLVCSVLFGVWLGICRGFKCLKD